MDELTIKLIVLLFPGALAAIILKKLTVHKKWNSFDFTVVSIVLGLISYFFVQLACFLVAFFVRSTGNDFTLYNLRFWEFIFDSKETVPYPEILAACIAGVVVGLLVSYLDYHKILTRYASSMNISRKYGDENLYSFFLNSRDIEIIWVRDEENNLIYEGVVDSFSESDQIRELVMRDVKIYRDTKDKGVIEMYDVPSIYLSVPQEKFKIEAPILKEG